MTKRSPIFGAAIIATYAFLALIILAMIVGASYTALSVFILLSEGSQAALPYFYIGVGLIAFGYLINVFLTFILTKQWKWRISNSFEFKEAPKKSKKK